MRKRLTWIACVVLTIAATGCASTTVLRPEDQIYPHTKVSVHFVVPVGVASIAGRTSGRVPNRLIPTNGDRAILTLLSYRNTWESQSEQKSAQDYLYAIRHEHDPNASLKIVGSFETARYGQRNVYRCCCDYNSFVNEWLVVFITDGHNAVDIDAWTPLCGGTLQYQPTIQAIARSVTFKNI
jgi:hypothetical protein